MLKSLKKKRGLRSECARGVRVRPGFSLIEMLVVITIIGVLATVAIGGYTRYRKVSLLNLATDNVVASLYEMRDRVSLGGAGTATSEPLTGGGPDAAVGLVAPESAPQCYGLSFNNSGGKTGATNVAGGGQILKINTLFNSKKEYKDGQWVYSGCEDFGSGEADGGFDRVNGALGGTDGTFGVAGMPVDLDSSVIVTFAGVSPCVILFEPPKGEISNKSTCIGSVSAKGEKFDVTLQYGAEMDAAYQRIISIDSKTGIAVITSPEDGNNPISK